MTERRPRRRPGENRERLLKAGLVEFGLHGYHGASTAAIAARADVPQPHVYASFRTKQELFLACAERAVDEASSVAAAAAPPELARFLLQLVAAAVDPSAPERLQELVSRLSAVSGTSGLTPWLERALSALPAR